jgi:hypothetical protein
LETETYPMTVNKGTFPFLNDWLYIFSKCIFCEFQFPLWSLCSIHSRYKSDYQSLKVAAYWIDTFNKIYLSRESEILFVIFSIRNEIEEGKISIPVTCSARRIHDVRQHY